MSHKNNNKYNSNKLTTLIDQAKSSFEAGNFSDTIKKCQTAISHYREEADNSTLSRIYFTMVLAMMKANKYEKLDQIIEQARQHLGSYLDLTFMHIISAYGNRDYKKVLELVEKYTNEYNNTDISIDPHLKQSYTSLDEIYWLASEAAGFLTDVDNCLKYRGKSVEANPRNHAHRVEYATLLAKQNRAVMAIKALDDGIAMFPDQIALKNAKGFILGEIRQYKEAEEYINELLQKYPENTDALNNLGVVYDSQGKYELAKEQFRKVLEIDPKNSTARANLKYVTDLIDDKPQTITACMMVKDEEKFLPGCLASIKGLVDEIIIVDTGSTDRTMEIAAEYGAKIYEHPWQNDFSLHRNQSIGYATCDWILIIDADEELDPTEHETIKMAVRRKDIEGISFVVYNKIQMGRIGFLNSHRLFRNYKGYKYHGIVHNQLEMNGKTLMSQFKVIHHGYGLSDDQMEKKGRRSEALLLKQLEENPGLVFPHFNLAQIYRGLSEPEKSLEHAKIVVEKISPDDLDHRHVRLMSMDQMGCAYLGLNQNDKAEEIFKKALETRDDYLDPLFNLGFMYMRQKRFEDAENVFHRYLKAREEYRPENEWMGLILNNLSSQFAVYYSLGFIHFLRNEIDNALDYFLKSLDQTEDFEYLNHLIARCYRYKAEFKKIIYHCAKAIEYGHDDAEIRLLEGEALLNLGQADQARLSFNKALEFEPENENAMLGLVGADSLDKNPQELLAAIDKFLDKSPHSPQGLASKGDILFGMGDYIQALSSYKVAAVKYPNDYKVLNNLGNCFLKEKNYASAETYYLMALQRNKNFLTGYRNLAIALIHRDKLSDAVEYLEFYSRNIPGDIEVHATLGDLYYKLKEYSKAINHFEHYIAANPANMDAIIRLSDCYFNLGKLQAAAAGYYAVLAKDSTNQTAKQRLNDLNAFLQPAVNK